MCMMTNVRIDEDLGSLRRGFSFVEILIVVSIMCVLVGMLTPILGLAQRQARVANTKSILMKVDQAIRLFRADMRIYPWQIDYGMPPTEPSVWGNDLGYRLAWDPPAAGSGTAADPDRMTYLSGFHDDLTTIQAKFAFVDGANVPPHGLQSEGTHAFRNESPAVGYRTNLLLRAGTLRYTSNLDWYTPDANPEVASAEAQVLTRMAGEISVLKYTAGQLPTLAPVGVDPADPVDKAAHPAEDGRYASIIVGGKPFGYVPYNKVGDSRGPVLAVSAAKAHGWRGDYLADALRSGVEGHDGSGLMGNAILDVWGHPLVYVCAVSPGCRGSFPGFLIPNETRAGTQEARYNMDPQGRKPTNVLASDVRTSAASAYALEFELWSAGPDGSFSAMRQDPGNRDNIAVVPYQRGLR
jgi:prepilin-type N-terminal cleavage/methylation domain-containing protein